MFWGKLRQRGKNVCSSVEGELQQHIDYSTLLLSTTLHQLQQTLHYIGRRFASRNHITY